MEAERDARPGPEPFQVYKAGVLLHGTRADLAVGDMLVPGHISNVDPGRIMNHVYVTETLDAATWGAELSRGPGPGHIFIVEPTGVLEDDPNLTNSRYTGNPTRSYRSRAPLRIVGELPNWVGHTPEQVQAMKDTIADLQQRGEDVIYD